MSPRPIRTDLKWFNLVGIAFLLVAAGLAYWFPLQAIVAAVIGTGLIALGAQEK